jgi:hypothetical protein
MPFLRAANMVHQLNYQLFERHIGGDDVDARICDYLIGHGAEKYVFRGS